MFNKYLSALLAGLPLAASLSVHAQDQSSPFEEIIVIANRTPVPLRQIGTSVTVIDEALIQAHGNFSITDVLRQTPSVGVSSNGGMGTLSTLRIRGEEGYRTLFLLDGLRLGDPSSGPVTTPVESILSNGVSRVEILRGPQGLSYGADAGGVVSISTHAAESELSVGIDAQSGSRGTNQAAATISEGEGRVDFYFNASDFQTDGYNVRESDTVLADDDGYENTSYHARVGFDIRDNWRLEVAHRNADSETEYDGCFAGFSQVHDCEALFEQEASRLAVSYASELMTHSLAYSTTSTDRDDLANGVSSYSSNGELDRVEYVGNVSNLPGFDLVFGFDLEEEDSGFDSRGNEGYFLEYLSDFSHSFYVTAGIRHDSNDDFGDHDSYRVSSAYLVDIGKNVLKFKASVGTGFRAPSLYEIDYNQGAFAYPPASTVTLSEESSEGFEAGVEYISDSGLRLDLVYFDQEIEDAIYFDLASFSGFLQDSGTSNSKGYELSAEFALTEQFLFSANYTYNETERPDGQQRLRRPEQLANLGVRYQSNSDKLKLNAFYRASRDSIDEAFGSPMPIQLDDFEVLDISASYTFSETFEIYARLENALDEEYKEVADYRAPEQASYIGLRLSF